MNDSTQAYIKLVKSSNASPEQKALAIFGRLTEDEKLFDKAFHHHKTTKKEGKRILHLWSLAAQLGGMNDTKSEEPETGQPEAEQSGRLRRPGAHQGPPVDSDLGGQEEEPTT